MSINIKGLDKAKILFELYRASSPPKNLPSGQTEKDVYGEVTLNDLKTLVEEQPNPDRMMFETLGGRSINVILAGDVLQNEDRYDANCPGGTGSCAKVIASLKGK